MSISRAQFLKSLGASVVGLGMASGLTGVAGLAVDVSRRLDSGAGSLASNLSASVFSQGNPFGRQIALTFEDGPTPVVTREILAELKKRHLTATFFVLGQRVLAEPDLVRQIKDEGHEIGSHGFSHSNFSLLPAATIAHELERTQEVVAQTTGSVPAWLRAPGVIPTLEHESLARNQNLNLAGWSVDSQDLAQTDGKSIARSILNETRNGSIILCRDLSQPTAGCMDEVLDGLEARGFELVTVSKLFAQA